MVKLRASMLLCSFALLLVTGSANAQDVEPAAAPASGDRPRSAQRIVRTFDFEEWLTNPLEIPAGWVRAQHDPLVPRDRPGFPIWNKASLDYDMAATGDGSVRLPVKGGSTSLRLNPGVLPIFPLARYAISAKVRSEGLEHARPRIAVRALDDEGNPIAGSERSTIADHVDGQWKTISVELPGLYVDAAYLQIELEVVQPREFQTETLPGHQVWHEDFEGAAWFDDVIVMQVPQLTLRTTSVLNVVARPEAPVLKAELRDLTAEDMTAIIRVYDARRKLIDSMDRHILTGRSAWEWQPKLGELGWYRAVIDIITEKKVISSRACDFVWVDEPGTRQSSYESGPVFSGSQTHATGRQWRPVGLELRTLPPASPSDLAQTLGLLGIDSTTLPVWESSVTLHNLPDRVGQLQTLLSNLREHWIDARLSLPVVPQELATSLSIGEEDILDVFTAPPMTWEPYLLDALDRLGTTSTTWQLGASGSTNAFLQPNLAEHITTARTAISAMVPGVEISIGWRADLSPAVAQSSGTDAVRLELPAFFINPPPATITPWIESEEMRADFVLEPLEEGVHTERDIAADLVRRAVALWAEGTREHSESNTPPRLTVAIPDPWRIEPGETPTAHPTVAAGAWRAVADRLRGRRLAVVWPITPGVRCLVFTAPSDDPTRGGLLVAWQKDATPEDAFLKGILSKEPVWVYDIFGNSRLLEPTSSTDGTRIEHHIALSPEPVFVEGINTRLVEFLTSISLDPSAIESTTGQHEHELVIHNPWDVPATGRIIITEPGGYDPASQTRDRSWEITPRSMSFNIKAGETTRIPLLLSFSRTTEAGVIPFVFDVQLVSDQDYGWIRAHSQAEIVWQAVQLELAYRNPAGSSRNDLLIEATVTNTGETPRVLEALAFAPGMPRGRASIGTLEPGQTIVRRFAFPEGLSLLSGKRVLVSLSEADGPGRLTKGIQVP